MELHRKDGRTSPQCCFPNVERDQFAVLTLDSRETRAEVDPRRSEAANDRDAVEQNFRARFPGDLGLPGPPER